MKRFEYFGLVVLVSTIALIILILLTGCGSFNKIEMCTIPSCDMRSPECLSEFTRYMDCREEPNDTNMGIQ